MKRFSRLQIILAVATVVLLALSILFIIGYFSADSKTAGLKKDIAAKQSQINNLAICDINDKNMQLEECKNKISTQSPFPAEPYDNKEMTDAIIGVVADARVQLETLDHKGLSSLQLGATTYAVDNYHLSCSVDEGKGNSLIALLELFEELREEKYNTLQIQSVQLPTGRTQINFDIGIVTQ
jgi:hypothetical protein